MGDLNVPSRTIFTGHNREEDEVLKVGDRVPGDNLEVMRGLNSDSVDLIYADPPFNSKETWRRPIGIGKGYNEFKDKWNMDDIDEMFHAHLGETDPALFHLIEAVKAMRGEGSMWYALMMAPRLQQMERILKPGGSVYLHCDTTESHTLKLMMDYFFGHDQFRNEIVWKRTGGRSDGNRYGRVKDVILYYAPEGAVWNQPYVPHDEGYVKKNYRKHDERGQHRLTDLTAAGASGGASGRPWRGVDPTLANRHWSAPAQGNMAKWIGENVIPGYPDEFPSPQDRLDALDAAGLVYWPPKGKMPQLKAYLAAYPGTAVTDLFTDIPPVSSFSKQRRPWPTQKPLRLLERIIQASSNPGDMVFDPFCGVRYDFGSGGDFGTPVGGH